MSMQELTNRLLEEQITSWPLLCANWEKLDSVLLKTFNFDGFSIEVQFNPKRITSSAAKVDKGSIEKRPCFLCPANRPAEEKHVVFGSDYEILCNPFPIFRKHYTIAKADHTPQVIDPEFSRMLDMSRELPELVVFYNAPTCGASAPDHMHFQAGSRGLMPIEEEIGSLLERFGNPLATDGLCQVTALNDGLRRFLVLESDWKQPLETAFTHISSFMRRLMDGGEPMLNIMAYFNERWQILVFPREKHRPWQFFEEGEKNILLSPASVDMGGIMITPLEKDFNKITEDDIVDIFTQIGLTDKRFDELCTFLTGQLS
ncbi:MAG: DUF4922 domain-containing protein [Bacteroidetes bacterium]|nr:DUF4922 domain-containing protein [Bacteroidota bacterium]